MNQSLRSSDAQTIICAPQLELDTFLFWRIFLSPYAICKRVRAEHGKRAQDTLLGIKVLSLGEHHSKCGK